LTDLPIITILLLVCSAPVVKDGKLAPPILKASQIAVYEFGSAMAQLVQGRPTVSFIMHYHHEVTEFGRASSSPSFDGLSCSSKVPVLPPEEGTLKEDQEEGTSGCDFRFNSASIWSCLCAGCPRVL
jgi:hypothetical protein